MIQQWEQLT